METRFRTVDSVRQGDPLIIGHPGKLVVVVPTCQVERTLRFTGIAPTIYKDGTLTTCTKDSDIAYDCECGERHIVNKNGELVAMVGSTI